MDNLKWNLGAERDLWRAICSPKSWFDVDGNVATHPRSLWHFVKLAWGSEFYFRKHPAQPRWLIEKIHGPYLEWLQGHLLQWQDYCNGGGTDRTYLACILPRGFGKSVTTTKASMLWVHLRDPDMSTLIATGVSELSEDFFANIKSVLEGTDGDSWFAWLFGNWRKGAQKWTKEGIEHGYRQSKNMSEGSFDITAVNIGMTGYHHRIHCWDDPIIKNKLREDKEAYPRAVHEAVNASYNALQTNGLLMFVLTRYFDNDIAGKHLHDEGVATWSGMECPTVMMFDKVPMGQGIWHVYFMQTEDELTGEPTHPLLWDKKKIVEAKVRDPEDFACNQQNNPGTGERAPILEWQLRDIYMDYKDFLYTVPIEAVSLHIDTAFKTLKTVRTGDDNAIVPWFHDARRNGIIYLDTDNIGASNEWREEEFNTELIKRFVHYRRRVIRVKRLTDEIEKAGKAGTYKNRLLSVLGQAGIPFPATNFIQINRTQNKKARIRQNIGFWAEGYVRILLHKDDHGNWLIPQVVRKLLNQILKIDIVEHEDIADASVDVFIPGIWLKPQPLNLINSSEEGSFVREPGDDSLKAMSRPLTTEELYVLMDENKEVQKTMGPGHGWDDPDNPYNDEFQSPRDPI